MFFFQPGTADDSQLFTSFYLSLAHLAVVYIEDYTPSSPDPPLTPSHLSILPSLDKQYHKND